MDDFFFFLVCNNTLDIEVGQQESVKSLASTLAKLIFADTYFRED